MYLSVMTQFTDAYMRDQWYPIIWCIETFHCSNANIATLKYRAKFILLFYSELNYQDNQPNHSKMEAVSHWRRNGRDGVSNHQPHDCLLNCLFTRGSKKTSKLASLAFVWGIHRWPVNIPHKGPVTRKMFPFDDVIMCILDISHRPRSFYLHWGRM